MLAGYLEDWRTERLQEGVGVTRAQTWSASRVTQMIALCRFFRCASPSGPAPAAFGIDSATPTSASLSKRSEPTADTSLVCERRVKERQTLDAAVAYDQVRPTAGRRGEAGMVRANLSGLIAPISSRSHAAEALSTDVPVRWNPCSS